MRKIENAVHLEGYLSEHDLQLRETGPNSKNPGTEYIMGTISIATDDAMTNIVPVHFTYVTAKTSKGNDNATFGVLKKIIDGEIKSVMGASKDEAATLRIDTAIGLNEFYSDRSGTEELVSVKRNEGGFIHLTPTLPDEPSRNVFTEDILITSFRTVEGDPDQGTKDKGIVKGAIFDFRNSLLPVEFSVTHPGAIAYFEGLGASSNQPVFTKVRGKQVSETVVKKTVETGAFGDDYVRETTSSRKDWVITWAAGETYEWDSEDSITASELKEAMHAREIYLADMKSRQDAFKAQRATASAPEKGGYDF